MIYKVYCYRNKKVGVYMPPVCTPFEKEEKIEQDQRTFILCKPDDREVMKECDLYYLGLFDDKSGEFTLELKPEYLCSFNEAKEDGKEE